MLASSHRLLKKLLEVSRFGSAQERFLILVNPFRYSVRFSA